MEISFFLIFLSVINIVHSTQLEQGQGSLIPLNFADAIIKQNYHKNLLNNFNSSSIQYFNNLSESQGRNFVSLFDNYLHVILERINSESNFQLNVSKKCLTQLTQFVEALKQRELWSLQGI